ncbi:MAG: transglycosylase SLT domain-containing protein [Parvularculaceae bacterium]
MRKIRAFALAGLAAAAGAYAAAFAATPAAPRLKPPAPGPAYMSVDDLSRVREVKSALDRRDFASAKSLGALVADPTARSLAQWYYFDAEDPQVSIEDTRAYLDANPDWPSQNKIQGHAEERMLWTTPPQTILEFFDHRDPLTGAGKLQLARAQFATGAREAGLAHLRDAWINENFDLADEQRLIANYSGRLTNEDHAARTDRLLWARQVTSARRVFSRLDAGERRKAEARAALLTAARNAERLYNHLSEADREDAGVALAAVRYFRRKHEEPRAVSIVRNAPDDAETLRAPDRWWYEQNLLMRWAMKNGQYADAYAMASHHALTPGTSDFAEAEFAAGWIALRFLNEPARAEQHFAALTANVGAPISLARGWYWLARAAEAMGETEKATARYEKAAEHIYTFYGQLAAEKIGGEALMRHFEPPAPATPEEKARFAARPASAALRMLTDIRDERAFLIFAYHIDDMLGSRGEFRELADLAIAMNAPHVAVRAGKVAVRNDAFSADIAYPDVAVPNSAARFAPAEIILGLSRQESEFNPRAYSRAGARGVMQLIPSTALATARKEGLKYSRSALLDDPDYNMTLGSAHLSHLIARFDGSWIMTFAAYNAGANRVDQWVDAYGDLRSAGIDPLDWIEQIPFEETRNYVQRVLENSQIYRSRLTGKAIAGALSGDIERGGASSRIGAVAPLEAAGVLPEIQPRIADMAAPILNPPIAQADAQAPHAQTEPAVPDSKARNSRSDRRRKSATPARRQSIRLEQPAAPTGAPAHDESATQSAQQPQAPAPQPTPAPVNTPANTAEPISANAAAPVFETAPRNEVDPDAGAAEPEYFGGADAPAGFDDMADIGADAAFAEDDIAAAGEECLAYGDYIARTAREEATAADLNAGALAELIGGGSACDAQNP